VIFLVIFLMIFLPVIPLLDIKLLPFASSYYRSHSHSQSQLLRPTSPNVTSPLAYYWQFPIYYSQSLPPPLHLRQQLRDYFGFSQNCCCDLSLEILLLSVVIRVLVTFGRENRRREVLGLWAVKALLGRYPGRRRWGSAGRGFEFNLVFVVY
jgi:hypothetical protein